ncbi:MAG: zinc ribbon domain-containing protein [Thermodesulfobacteriota bacterium]|nr:zinc ribbon domain-containing protein [Thermodesulfobacteriota bacterium]
MFFFIAGIQPRTIKLDDHPRMCPSCGLNQAHLKRTDHYLSFFFLPVFRVKKGFPFLECRRCGSLFQESGSVWSETPQERPPTCPYCEKQLEQGYRFCPFCGKPV